MKAGFFSRPLLIIALPLPDAFFFVRVVALSTPSLPYPIPRGSKCAELLRIESVITRIADRAATIIKQPGRCWLLFIAATARGDEGAP